MSKFQAFLGQVLDLLQGETARAIGYGGGLVLYFVARAFAIIPDVPLDQALALGLAYAGILATFVESIRHFVGSPLTLASLQDEIAALKAELAAAQHPLDPYFDQKPGADQGIG